MRTRAIVIFACFALIAAVSSCKHEIPFDRQKWRLEGDDRDFGGEREAMLDDLLQHHRLVGIRYSELQALLGEPDGNASYLIKQTWDVIDPDYRKDLIFKIDRDSIVRKYEVHETYLR